MFTTAFTNKHRNLIRPYNKNDLNDVPTISTINYFFIQNWVREVQLYYVIFKYLPICNRIVNLFIFTYKNAEDYSRKWVDQTVMIFPLLNTNSYFNKNTDRYLCCYLCCHLSCYVCTPLQRHWQNNTFPSCHLCRNYNQTNCIHVLCNKRWTCF